MSVVIDFVKNDSERETTGVFTFEGYPTSPLRLPRLTPLIKRPVPCVQAAPSLPTRSNAESSSDSNSKPSQPIPISIHDVFRMKACTELVPIERPTDKQDIPSSKRKNDDSEEANSDAEVEHERCENCSTDFDPSSERLPHECSYHPGQKLTDQEVLGEYVRQGRFTAYGTKASDHVWSCCDDRCGETPGCESGEHISPGLNKRRRWAKVD